MWKRSGFIPAGALSALLSWANSGQAQTPVITDLQQAKRCSIRSTMAAQGQVGNVVGTAKIEMTNDGGWCWLSMWGTQGSLLYAPTYRVSRPPAHGDLLMGEVNKRRRIAYKPASGFVGEDTYTMVNVMNNLVLVVTVTVGR